MTASQPKADLQRYLQSARDALLWKLEGLSEYDVRRPLTPTGTNLLGLVKHAAGVELGYFGETFRRPFGEAPPAYADDAEANQDMWATADESREDVLALYRRVAEHADATIAELPLDAVGHVRWWPDGRNRVTLHQILVHVIADLQRHALPRRHRPGARRRDGGAAVRHRQHAAGRPRLVGGVPAAPGAGGAGGRVAAPPDHAGPFSAAPVPPVRRGGARRCARRR